MSLKDLRRLRVTIKKAFEFAACIAVASTAFNRVASSRAKQIFEPGGYVPGFTELR